MTDLESDSQHDLSQQSTSQPHDEPDHETSHQIQEQDHSPDETLIPKPPSSPKPQKSLTTTSPLRDSTSSDTLGHPNSSSNSRAHSVSKSHSTSKSHKSSRTETPPMPRKEPQNGKSSHHRSESEHSTGSRPRKSEPPHSQDGSLISPPPENKRKKSRSRSKSAAGSDELTEHKSPTPQPENVKPHRRHIELTEFRQQINISEQKQERYRSMSDEVSPTKPLIHSGMAIELPGTGMVIPRADMTRSQSDGAAYSGQMARPVFDDNTRSVSVTDMVLQRLEQQAQSPGFHFSLSAEKGIFIKERARAPLSRETRFTEEDREFATAIIGRMYEDNTMGMDLNQMMVSTVKARKKDIMAQTTLRSPRRHLSSENLQPQSCCSRLCCSCCSKFFGFRTTFKVLMFIALIAGTVGVILILATQKPDHDRNPLPFLLAATTITVALFIFNIFYHKHHQVEKRKHFRDKDYSFRQNLASDIRKSPTFVAMKGEHVVQNRNEDSVSQENRQRSNTIELRKKVMGTRLHHYEACFGIVRGPVLDAVGAGFSKRETLVSTISDVFRTTKRWFITGRFDWKGRGGMSEEDFGGFLEDETQYKVKRAVGFIEDQSYRNLVLLCRLEAGTNLLAFHAFRIYSNYWFNVVMLFMFWISIFLSFEDSAQLKDGSVYEMDEARNVGIESITHVFFIFSAIMGMLKFHKWSGKQNIEISFSGRVLSAMYAILVFWTFLVFLIKISTIPHINLEFVFPSRAFLPILFTHQIAYTARILALSVAKARHVLLAYFCVGVIIACLAYTVAGGRKRDDEDIDKCILDLRDKGVGINEFVVRPFGNYLSALSTVFVFISTGENFTELIYPALEEKAYFEVGFWLVAATLGLFVLVPVVISIFEHAYTTQQQYGFEKNRMFLRLKYAAAFAVLDSLTPREKESVNKRDFERLIRCVEGTQTKGDQHNAAMRVFNQMDLDRNGTLDVKEFCEGVEILFGGIFSVLKEPQMWHLRVRIRRVVSTETFRRSMLLLIVWQICMSTMLGLGEAEDNLNRTLDINLIVIFALTLLELGLKLFGYGLPMFYNLTNFNRKPYAIIQQFTNRYELFVVIVSLSGLFVCHLQSAEVKYFRFWLVFPVVRVFTLVKSLSVMTFALSKAFSPFLYINVLLFVVFYVYAVLGMAMFRGRTTIMSCEFGYDASFDNLFSAFLTLFQLFVGEAFHEIMFSFADVTSNWAIYYFISFVVLVSLLFANLFFGMILSIFSKLYDKKSSRMTNMNAARLQALTQRNQAPQSRSPRFGGVQQTYA